MHKLNPNTLFSIFEKGDEEVYKEHNLEDQLKNPFVLMGMVVKGLENFNLICSMYNNKPFIQKKYYTRLFGYLDRIDSDRFDDLYTIGESFESNKVNYALNHLLKYFEEFEEYEKCAIIKKFLDHLKIAKNITLKLEV